MESPELKAIIDKYAPFLAEVRRRVFFTLAVFAVSTLAGRATPSAHVTPRILEPESLGSPAVARAILPGRL